MADGAALDTDVLLKASAWGLADALLATLRPLGQPGTLGLTHLIAQKQIRRLKGLRDVAAAEAELAGLLGQLGRLEPDVDEIGLAAEIVEAAARLNLPLDRGEAQIAAVLISRTLPVMVTGDKRAIVALGPALAEVGRFAACDGRLACLEQLLLAMASTIGLAEVRRAICTWSAGDKAASICFACGRDVANEASILEGLASYIGSVRKACGALLCVGISELASMRKASQEREHPPAPRQDGSGAGA
ncbi:hypothetical protein [Falsiroseomonas ponticola]|uniref:hypothetical protein n=1 Tax=Falsiroseomonas ponticola TaxID=2786951 RepID=UPI001931C41F|nr:hypothetical protein [Roseomonas ponticola]